MSFNYDERAKIMHTLIGEVIYKPDMNYYPEYRCANYPLIGFMYYGVTFKDTATLELIISELQKFKACVEAEETKEERKRYLTNREKEIKQQLGIK